MDSYLFIHRLFDANGHGFISESDFKLILKMFREFTDDENIECINMLKNILIFKYSLHFVMKIQRMEHLTKIN